MSKLVTCLNQSDPLAFVINIRLSAFSYYLVILSLFLLIKKCKRLSVQILRYRFPKSHYAQPMLVYHAGLCEFAVCCRWFCHFDDDSYVHVANLLQLLRRYDSRDDCYLGRPSLSGPMTLRRNVRASCIFYSFFQIFTCIANRQ